MLKKFFAFFVIALGFAIFADAAKAGCSDGRSYRRSGNDSLECRLESAVADVGAATVRGFGTLPAAGSQMLAAWALFQMQDAFFGGGVPGMPGRTTTASCQPHDIRCRTREAQRQAVIEARVHEGDEAEQEAYERYYQQERRRLKQTYAGY